MSVHQARSKLSTIVRRLTSHKASVGSGGPLETYWSAQAAVTFPLGLGTEVDHAVPVACIVEDMLLTARKENSAVSWMSLEDGFILVRVTKLEHSTLSRASMPSGWRSTDDNPWWVRYEAAGIQVPWIEVVDPLTGARQLQPR